MTRSSRNSRAGRRAPATLVDNVELAAEERAEPARFFSRDGRGWHGVTCQQFHRDVCAAGWSMRDLGVARGDRVAILARPCYHWEVADKAVMFAGGATVGIDPRGSADDVGEVLASAAPVGLVVEDAGLLATIDPGRLGSLRFVLPLHADAARDAASDTPYAVVNLEHLLCDGDARPFEPLARPDDIGVIIFTSGTTGRAKGIPLTHRQLVGWLPSVEDVFGDELDAVAAPRTLAWVPLHNGTGRCMGTVNFHLGVAQYFVPDPTALVDAVREVEPHYLVVMPRILEKVHQAVQQRLAAAPPAMRLAARGLLAVRRRRATAWLAPIADRLMLARMRHAIWGPAMRFLISGSAPVDPAILRFFDVLGTPTLEVYGLSEVAFLIAMNRLGRIRYGSVGEPSPGIEVRIAADGEVLARSEYALQSYWGDQVGELFDADGFLPTGDLGELRDGYLYLEGRKKEIIKTSTGQRISPVEVERAYGDIPGVDQLVVIGNGRPFLTALVAMERDFVTGLESQGRAVDGYLAAAIVERGARLASHRRIGRIAVLERPLSVEAGELTPTLKLRRARIEENWRTVIDGLYAGERG